jgi:hypothetical protein
MHAAGETSNYLLDDTIWIAGEGFYQENMAFWIDMPSWLGCGENA